MWQAASGGAAYCRRSLALDFLNQTHDRVPHHLPSFIHVPVWVGHNLGIRAKLKVAQNSPAGKPQLISPTKMEEVSKSLKKQRDAKRLRALASHYDPVRQRFNLGLADEIEREAQALLIPEQPLLAGLGGEIIPPVEHCLPGLESVLKEPDLLNLGASEQRAQLLERNGVLELGVEAAHDAQAQGAVQKMVSHQLAAGHKRAMELLDESASAKDPDIAIKKARASARLMDAFSRSALTLQRLQSGGGQTIQVQYMQVNAMVGAAAEKIQNPLARAPKPIGGRPPLSGYRTQEAINQRSADRELLSSMKRVEDIA